MWFSNQKNNVLIFMIIQHLDSSGRSSHFNHAESTTQSRQAPESDWQMWVIRTRSICIHTLNKSGRCIWHASTVFPAPGWTSLKGSSFGEFYTRQRPKNGDDLDDQSSKVFIHEKWKTLPPALLQQRASSLKTSWSLVHSLYILLFVWFLWFVDRMGWVSLSWIISTYTGPTSYCP